MQLQTPQDTPTWHDGVEQRLFASMLLAVLLVAGALSLIRMPAVPAWSPVVELLVRIVWEEPAQSETESLPVPAPMPATEPDATAGPTEAPPTMGREVLEESPPGTDWKAMNDQAVREYLDSEVETYGYFNADLAEKRRRLAERYQPRTHPGPKPIWENVEKDSLGRNVLRSENCSKVLDDPNVGSHEAFEQFGQFVVQCTYQGRYPRELPWVEGIRQRYVYLRDPDGYVKGEAEE